MNVKFKYLYRDGANYKMWGDVVFLNPNKVPLKEIRKRLDAAFLPDGLFIAHQIAIPERFIFLKEPLTPFDHCYHEFDDVAGCYTSHSDVAQRSISVFLETVEFESRLGWKAFDVLDRT